MSRLKVMLMSWVVMVVIFEIISFLSMLSVVREPSVGLFINAHFDWYYLILTFGLPIIMATLFAIVIKGQPNA